MLAKITSGNRESFLLLSEPDDGLPGEVVGDELLDLVWMEAMLFLFEGVVRV